MQIGNTNLFCFFPLVCSRCVCVFVEKWNCRLCCLLWELSLTPMDFHEFKAGLKLHWPVLESTILIQMSNWSMALANNGAIHGSAAVSWRRGSDCDILSDKVLKQQSPVYKTQWVKLQTYYTSHKTTILDNVCRSPLSPCFSLSMPLFLIFICFINL